MAGSGEAGGSSSPPGSPAAATTPQKEEDLPRGEPIPLYRSLQDPPRRVHHLLVAPRWALVTCADLRRCIQGWGQWQCEWDGWAGHVQRYIAMARVPFKATAVRQRSVFACRGCLAAASDALGRVLLVDVASLTVIRVWKAYRNAQLAWLMLDVPAMEQHRGVMEADQLKSGADEEDKSEAGGNSTQHAALDAAGGPLLAQPRSVEHSDEHERQQQPLQQHGRKRKTISSPERPGAQPGMLRQQLCLVLYAKRLGVLEIWPMRYGSRLCSIRCGPDCCLVPNALPFGMQTRVGSGEPIPFGCQLLAMKSGVMQSVQELIMHDLDHSAA